MLFFLLSLWIRANKWILLFSSQILLDFIKVIGKISWKLIATPLDIVSHSLNYSWISLSMRGQLNIISDITIIWTMAHIFLFSWKCIDNLIRLQSATSSDWYVYTNIQITSSYNIQIGNRFFSLVKQIVPLSNINIMYYNSFGKYTQRYPAVISENYSTFFSSKFLVYTSNWIYSIQMEWLR